MNSGEIGFILFIVLFIGFGKLKEIRSGELGKFLSGLFWMVKTSQNDIFDEEGKSLLVQKSNLSLYDVEYKLVGMNLVPVDKNTGKPLDEKQLDMLRKQLMKEWRFVDEDEEE